MLALWAYAWEESDWSGVPAPAAVPASPTNAGGGGRKRRKYTRADDEYWELRERYIRRFAPKLPKSIASPPAIAEINLPNVEDVGKMEEPAPGGALLLQMQAQQAALQRAQNAQTLEELQAAVRAANARALDISKIQQQYYDRAIAILLLDAQ